MRVVAIAVAAVVFLGMTAAAFLASAAGWGLPGTLDRPVSIRQESPGGGHHHGLYFSGTRRHFGGGFHGGK